MPILDYDDPQVWFNLYEGGVESHYGGAEGRPEVRLGYIRQRQWSGGVRYSGYYLQLPGLTTASTVAIVGSGFAYSAEYMRDALGFANVIGIDTASWIHANKGLPDDAEVIAGIQAAGLDVASPRGLELLSHFTSNGIAPHRAPRSVARARATILDENASNNGSRRAIRAELTGNGNTPIDWAIGEGMVESLTDSEIQQASALAHQYAMNVAWTFIPRDPGPGGAMVGGYWNNRGRHPLLNWKPRAEWTALLPNDYLICGLIKPARRITLNGMTI